MQEISATSLTSAVKTWLAETRQPRILHIFDNACNLINERKEVLSIVTPGIGEGPFNLVVAMKMSFAQRLSLRSHISNFADQLNLGDFIVNTKNTNLWNPQPDWKPLHDKKENLAKYAAQLPLPDYPASISQFSSSLFFAIANADSSTAKTTASQLAGLGQGLTPSGDDILMGALHAAWILHPREVAAVLVQGVAESAAPLTTSLSAAWLKSAARGEAGIRWHEFFGALNLGDESRIKESIEKILAVGETSGADALTGFIGTMTAWEDKI